MKQIKPILFLLALSGCIKPVDIDIEEYPSKIVINSILQSDSAIMLHASYSSSTVVLLESVNNGFNEKISLFTSSWQEYPGSVAPHVFKTKTYTPVEGDTIHLEIQSGKSGAVTASDVVPGKTPFSITAFNKYAGIDEDGDEVSKVEISFSEKGDKANFYEVKCCFVDKNGFPGYPVFLYPRSNNLIFNEGESAHLLFDDRMINGKDVALAFNFMRDEFYFSWPYDEDRKICGIAVTLNTLSYNTFMFKQSAVRQDYAVGDMLSFDLFSQISDPLNLYSNIEGGLGIFGAIATTRDTLWFNSDALKR